MKKCTSLNKELIEQERKDRKNSVEEEHTIYEVVKIAINVPNLKQLTKDQLLDFENTVEVVDEFLSYEEAYEAIKSEYMPSIHEGKWRTKATLYFVVTHELTLYREFTVWDKYVIYANEENRQAVWDIYSDYPQYWKSLFLIHGCLADYIIDEREKDKYLREKFNELKIAKALVNNTILDLKSTGEWSENPDRKINIIGIR